jgi:hypothetical protein
MNYTVCNCPATKNTITITRKQLWVNFVDSWRDMAWDEFETFKDFGILNEVGEILCNGELDWTVKKLFRAGHTFMLMGDAMKHIDLPDPEGSLTLVEIVVVDGEKRVFVEHGDIQY